MKCKCHEARTWHISRIEWYIWCIHEWMLTMFSLSLGALEYVRTLFTSHIQNKYTYIHLEYVDSIWANPSCFNFTEYWLEACTDTQTHCKSPLERTKKASNRNSWTKSKRMVDGPIGRYYSFNNAQYWF